MLHLGWSCAIAGSHGTDPWRKGFHEDGEPQSTTTESLCHFSLLVFPGKLHGSFVLISPPYLLLLFPQYEMAGVNYLRGEAKHMDQKEKCLMEQDVGCIQWPAELFCPTRVVPGLTNFKTLSSSLTRHGQTCSLTVKSNCLSTVLKK